jgi:hypothetical protein
MKKRKSYRQRSMSEVRESAEYAIQNNRGMTINARWLIELLNGCEQLAMLASKTPQFFNPLHAFEAEKFRDYVLLQKKERQESLAGVKR